MSSAAHVDLSNWKGPNSRYMPQPPRNVRRDYKRYGAHPVDYRYLWAEEQGLITRAESTDLRHMDWVLLQNEVRVIVQDTDF